MMKINSKLKTRGKEFGTTLITEVRQGNEEKRVFLFPSRIATPLFRRPASHT